MDLEIHKYELVQRVNAQIQRRHLYNADELIEKALDALDEHSPAPQYALRKRTDGSLRRRPSIIFRLKSASARNSGLMRRANEWFAVPRRASGTAPDLSAAPAYASLQSSRGLREDGRR